jgi:hypothetical protein
MIENCYRSAFYKPLNILSFALITLKTMCKYVLYNLNFFFFCWNS